MHGSSRVTTPETAGALGDAVNAHLAYTLGLAIPRLACVARTTRLRFTKHR